MEDAVGSFEGHMALGLGFPKMLARRLRPIHLADDPLDSTIPVPRGVLAQLLPLHVVLEAGRVVSCGSNLEAALGDQPVIGRDFESYVLNAEPCGFFRSASLCQHGATAEVRITLTSQLQLFGCAYGLGSAVFLSLQPCLTSLKQFYGGDIALAQMNLQDGIDHHCLPELLQEGLHHLLLKEALLHHEASNLQDHTKTWASEDFTSPGRL